MNNFTPLERTALRAILHEMGNDGAPIEEQLRFASVISRENTGGGFFVTLEVGDAPPLASKIEPVGQNVWISIDGLEYGLGMILHFREGQPSLLEAYGVGPEDTSGINFESVRFGLAKEPGPLLPNEG